ncbi:HET domain-containing protein [Microdochium nivale]|nr:HET domain-containing protein [Microdochium nivale]
MLCDVCKNGLEGMWDPTRTERVASFEDFIIWTDEKRTPLKGLEHVFGHHKTEASFKVATADGCTICNKYTTAELGGPPVGHQRHRNIDYFSVFYVLDGKGTQSSELGEPLMVCNFGRSRASYGSRFFLCREDPESDQRDSLHPAMGSFTGDDGTRQTIQGWMRECLETHSICQRRQAKQTGYRPTRLLELSPHGTWRLVNGVDCPAVLRYAALSYCWGDQPVERLLRLLKTTSQLLSDKQAIDTLPKTFREAAQIAQWFQVNYLWIDRLCIYQDSASDWQREAGTMKDVYQNAEFSIAALGAQDSDGGCFFERSFSKLTFTIVRMKLADADPPMAFRCDMDSETPWEYIFQRDPLTTRSWVVQERLLAPRTVYLGSRQVFWECSDSGYAEMYPHINISATPNHESLCSWKRLLDAKPDWFARDQYEQLFENWNALVALYSTKRLTMPADKLIAISGLAKDMKASLCAARPGIHRYFAGLWEDDFPGTLGWKVTGPAYRVPEYRAPSWSWASLDGGVAMYSSSFRDHAGKLSTLEATDVTYSNEDETGEVRSGTITLRGPCSKARFEFGSDNTGKITSVEDRNGDNMSEIEEHSSWWSTVTFDTLSDFMSEAMVIWLNYYLPIQGSSVSGLILASLKDGTFRRLGVAQIHFERKEAVQSFKDDLAEACVAVV